MKAPEKSKVKKQKIKKKPIDKSKNEKVLVVAQEFKFARLLSGNEKKTRDKVLKTLKKWLLNCFEKGYEFKEDDFVRVWKGLFYAVWMSDKPLVQEELCESIAEILDLFPPQQLQYALMMTKAGFKVLATEWYGIDQHRMDKFLMLVRRYLRGSLRCLLRCDWSVHSCRKYSKMLMGPDGILCVKTPQYAKNAMSMILHFTDCFLEELAKVSEGKIPEESLAELLYPFTSLVCSGGELVLCVAARRLLTALLRQSEQGLRYQEATRAWQKMGCPAGGPEALELVSDDEEEPEPVYEDHTDEAPSALDPRAGRVNVYLPLLPVPATLLAVQLRRLMTKASSKAYKRAKICLERFEALSKNEYPLVVPAEDTAGIESPTPAEEEPAAANRLRALEKQLVAQSDELALRGLKRKHRKRLLAKTRAGLSIIDDVAKLTDTQTNSINGEWQIEETEPDTKEKKEKEDSSKGESHIVKKNANRKRKMQENGPQKVKKVKKVDSDVSKTKVTDKSKDIDNNKVKSKKALQKQTDNKKEVLVNSNSKKAKKMKLDKAAKQKLVKNSPKLIETDKPTKQNDISKESEIAIKTIIVNKVNKDSKKSSKLKIKPAKVGSDAKTQVIRQKVLSMNKIKNYQKQLSPKSDRKKVIDTPKRVKFVLKNNSMQGTVDYFKSVRQSPNIPFDSSKKPTKTNLKPSTPSPINPFFKKKLKMKF